jgi:ketopantoate reductase
VLLTAKHYDLDAAIAAICPAVGPDTAVLPLLNGLVHLDRLDRAFGLTGCSAGSPMSARASSPTARSATTTGRAAYCHLQVHENRLALGTKRS